MGLDYDELMLLCIAAQRAGAEIASTRSKFEDLGAQQKSDGSPVTIADMNAHNIIVESLREIFPDIPILSEEGSEGNPVEHNFCFVVDPLDGTKEFIRGSDMYTVNIALTEKNPEFRWKPVCGVVHAPEMEKTWLGGCNTGAMLQDGHRMFEISVSKDRRIPVIVGSISHSSPLDRKFADSVGDHVFEGVGSSIKICRVADGSADMSPRFGPTSCWDTAAAHAVLNAAGGSLLGPDGAEIDYDLVGDILNPWYFATSNGKWVDQWMEHQY
jgi:3'(2'), 5'-bisphosphate nucleotidase